MAMLEYGCQKTGGNTKMKELDRSTLIGCRELKRIKFKSKKEKGTISLVEYIPYGAIQDKDYNHKLWALIKNYDGSIIWQKGAEVCVSLDLGMRRLKETRKFLSSKK